MKAFLFTVVLFELALGAWIHMLGFMLLSRFSISKKWNDMCIPLLIAFADQALIMTRDFKTKSTLTRYKSLLISLLTEFYLG